MLINQSHYFPYSFPFLEIHLYCSWFIQGWSCGSDQAFISTGYTATGIHHWKLDGVTWSGKYSVTFESMMKVQIPSWFWISYLLATESDFYPLRYILPFLLRSGVKAADRKDYGRTDLNNEWITMVFVEQPLASPGLFTTEPMIMIN